MDLFHTYVSDKAIEYATKVLDSTWLNEGEYVKRFEHDLSVLFGFPYCVTTNSCTAALHLSLVCAGVKPGDEVILPAQTFIATGMAVLMAGATPVFADINPRTGNISPWAIEEKITERTKAVIAVHWGGLPADMPAIHQMCDQFNIEVIEDAAHALGAKLNDIYIGCFSRFTCFSFQAIKFLTTGDGGLVTTLDHNTAKLLRTKHWFGFDKETLTRTFEGDRDVNVKTIGFKYNMNDIVAAIGCGNLWRIGERLQKRQEIAARYREEFKDVKGLTLLDISNTEPSYWLFTVLVENRKEFITKMKEAGIPVSVVDRRIDEHDAFGQNSLSIADLSNTTRFDAHQISIPVHERLTADDVELIIKTVREGW